MICECQCDDIIIVNNILPAEELKPSSLASKKDVFTGSVYINPKLNKFIQRIENVDEIFFKNKSFFDSKQQSGRTINRKYNSRTYPVVSAKSIDASINSETNFRNKKEIEYENKIRLNIFNSYKINLFDREEFFNEKSLLYFFDEDTSNTALKILSENVDDPILSYPIEFTNSALHRQGGRIEVFDVIKQIKNYGTNGDYTLRGIKSNLSAVTRTFNETIDNKILETENNVKYYDEGIIPDLLFNHSKTKSFISNKENFFTKNERNISAYIDKEEEKIDFNLKGIFNNNIKYTNSGRNIDYNLSNFSESISYEGLIN